MTPAKRAGGRGGSTPRRAGGITEAQRQRIISELARYRDFNELPNYTPIHKTYPSGKRITGYKDTRTGDVVTPQYYKTLRQAFTRTSSGLEYPPTSATPRIREQVLRQFEAGELERAEAFLALEGSRQRRTEIRHASIIESYQIKQASEGNIMSAREVARDPNFIALLDELESLTAQQRMFSTDNYEQMIKGTPQDIPLDTPNRREVLEAQAKAFRDLLGSNPRYQELLEELGRRLPGDTRPVGSYKSGELKLVVEPFYEQLSNYPGETGTVY